MATKAVTVILSSIGASAGPFNISDDALGIIAMNVTRAQLLAGYSVNVSVDATLVTVTSIGTCTTSLIIYLSTPTPTPTPTVTPTPTITPTPTQSPIYFDSNFTGTSNVCGQGGRIWSRLIAPSGTLVEFTVSAVQYITSISSTSACISGGFFETSLPAITPTVGTQITASVATVASANVPIYLTKTQKSEITIPSAGYKDFILVYNTKNISSNYSNGQFSAEITKVNGSSVSNGGKLSTWYNCSDTGTC
jgi:hypothetical protein